MTSGYIGAIDIGGTKIAASVGSPTGPLARAVQATVKSGAPEAVPQQAIALLEEACRQAGIEADRLGAVGVCSAGPFIRQDGMLAMVTPNICGGLGRRPDLPNDWTSVPLEAVLRQRFQTLAIDNDGVSALIAERTFGAALGEPDCVYATWSTGIGFGICADGKVLRGKHGNAGHAGHMLMSEVEQAQCGCGNVGDLEALISGRNIAHRGGKEAPALFAAARAGDPAAHAIAMQAARWFGRALYNLAATLDTRLFVVGGSVWEHNGDWLEPFVMEEIRTRLPVLTAEVELVPAALGGWVTDIGAFCLVLPETWVSGWRENQTWRAGVEGAEGGE